MIVSWKNRFKIHNEEGIMKKCSLVLLLILNISTTPVAVCGEVPMSDATRECIECHGITHPGIVESWKKSRHSMITPEQAMSVKGMELKVSAKSVPENLQSVSVGCQECHTLRPKAHADTFDHNGYDIHVVVSPKDCGTCHTQEMEQFSENLMAHAHGNLVNNPVFQDLQQTIEGEPERKDGRIVFNPADSATRAESCLYCHGTKLEKTGVENRDTILGEMQFPRITGWPNQGVGRINLDGSRGACSACHTRHDFSIEMARKPYTCKECHIGPDVPAFKVYDASKHGNIFSSMNKYWNFKPVPWTIGKDFTAPTCAACHISLLVNADQEMVVERTHQMNNRLPWRIFGLIYAHPHPKDPDTTLIRNKKGLPLPTDFDGEMASNYLIDEKERKTRAQTMQAGCLNCHDASWVHGHWQRFENTIYKSNAATAVATDVMQEIWKAGYACGVESGCSPFDEGIEKNWANAWLFYANTIRFASAMAGGGDYGVFANGRYQLSEQIQQLSDWYDLRSRLRFQKGPHETKSDDPAGETK
jgi:hydroxylamine dehydrogenase